MKILAIDTSNHPMSVALVENDQLLATTTLNMVRNHSIFLLPVIDDLFQKVQWQPQDLDRIVVAQGPGSYTGIRIAVTSAKVLADTLKIELVGISSLKTVAANVNPGTNALIVPFFDARRGNVFAGAYQWKDGQLISVLNDQHLAMQDLLEQLVKFEKPVLLAGELTDRLKKQLTAVPKQMQFLPSAFAIPSTYQLALLGAKETPVQDIDDFVPQYLRITEAEAVWQHQHPDAPKQDYVREV
ncbi:tRNA (adenosine(37)-N6)-threonylcarbamoyltransferase complex dimerization subunit type 1 TsaB [Limosilactobacillus mucosae]|uniref:tRNA (adenosine(37)-N6)-threonylcarbamoyltransferase complex dimerization subunit type 1 TsaB n=1 Tax=Limosilactobacillus mucosae TaxID=97478 RepID=UPI00233EB0D4|nr:tRNA (adenosine(37)-N6)-threonylcarbamoyltransferase complex dimerization subunit type 1 TsaB [Limosilactobacillus mucosae]MDC2839072.1 tRNA (adenosine(37)-N6)-threonylcarbamoyltransferase complex dimerization subunit type 1 TsaB [Limosilactobacillus mucosae]MDC2841503.1 tRNA (adenosine(37)-N6)-threonylcarbamoyltransferase complex dimerization subunit type 1 TsaB [Limosilactobacillus mucosae]MDC2845417.1 tRNA (adenosine(37)-N6)-threonylcarbamoyltransferase complex dimerization subunit type 1 